MTEKKCSLSYATQNDPQNLTFQEEKYQFITILTSSL